MEQPIHLLLTTVVRPWHPPRDSSPGNQYHLRVSRHGTPIGLDETDADRAPSNRGSLRMSPASNTRTVRTTRPWCSIPSREEATPGLAASRWRNGGSGPPAGASTLLAGGGEHFRGIVVP